jgi:type IV pilus assembly protein PilN
MYSLDVNFLKDRNLTGTSTAGGQLKTKKAKQPLGAMVPLYVGLGIMVLLPAIAGGFWLFLSNQKTQITAQIAEFDKQIQDLDAKQQKVKELEAKLAQADGETQALASVFTQIKPWSAMLQDIRDRIPPGVQLKSIAQGESKPPQGSTDLPKPQLTIRGFARTYNDVNDFLLTLQDSKFLSPDNTKIETANLVANPTKVQLPEAEESGKPETVKISVELPKVVEYTIVAQINDTPATELIRELDKKGSVGLVTRIRTLEQKGVIKP